MARVRILLARLVAFLLVRQPIEVTAGRHRFWFDPTSGRVIPAIAGAEGEGEGGGEGGEGEGGEGEGGGSGEGEGGGEGGEEKTAEDYRKELRTYERNAKRASAKKDKEMEELRKKLSEREDADKSEQEKAVEKAREEAKAEALTSIQKERRTDRLEAAVTRMAAKGVTIGEGDDAKTFKFADPEDALVFIERMISRGDLDEDEIFDDEHKVKPDALTAALVELAKDKPRLAADADNNGGVSGDAGAGKGSGGTSEEDMSPEDHLKAIQARNK